MKPLAAERRTPAPAFSLRSASDETVSLQDYYCRRDLVLLLLHGSGCPHCAGTVAELASHRQEIESWGAAAQILHSEDGGPFQTDVRQAADPEGLVSRRYGVPDGEIGIAVVDRRGILMEGWSVAHPEPVNWREVTETVRWVAVQEPECGACDVLPGYD